MDIQKDGKFARSHFLRYLCILPLAFRKMNQTAMASIRIIFTVMIRITILLLTALLLPVRSRAAREQIVAYKLTTVNGLPDNNIRSIRQDSAGYMYFNSQYATYRYDGYTFRKLTSAETAHAEIIMPRGKHSVDVGVEYDNLGNRYEVGKDGMLTYENMQTGGRMTLQVFDPMILKRNNSLKCRVITDRRGMVWVSINGNGLFLYNPSTRQVQHIMAGDGRSLIDSDYIVYMREDMQGRIWVSQEHYGVVCLSIERQDWQVAGLDGTPDGHGNVRMMHRLGNGSIVVAGNNGSTYLADSMLCGRQPLDVDGNACISALYDSRRRLWLGLRTGGVVAGGKRYGQGRVDCIMEDNRGRIWLCGIHGDLKRVDIDSHGRYSEKHFFTSYIKDKRPRVMVTDSVGRIWLGTDGGLFCFDADRPERLYRISGVAVRSMLKDSKGRLWVGAEGSGLYYVQDRRLVAAGTVLPNGVVQFIAETPGGKLCIGTEDGCVFFNPDKRTVERTLYFADRLTRNYYNENSCVQLADGRMAMGTLDGIVMADPKEPEAAKPVKPVALTGLSVDGTPADMPAKGGDIVVSHDHSSLALSFSNFAYGAARQTSYSFWLEGYDSEWSPLTHTNFVAYRNLPPGSYTLHARCRTADDEWSTASVGIRVLPPWWLTWWAFAAYVLLAAVVVYAVSMQIRRVARLRQRIALEKQLTDYKLKFFTNISHEFRTPLTLIQGAMDSLGQLKDTPVAARAPLYSMQRNVDRMLRLINQLLEFRRMQNNKLSLSLELTDIVAFVYNLCSGFTEAATQKHITLTFLPSVKSLDMYIDRGFVDKAVYNLLSNAFKYTPPGGSVTVRVKADDKWVRIECEDTGCGVPADCREKIFNRFEHGHINRDSLGIGLDLTAELIRTHNGTIDCGENPGGGSVFTIALPAGKDAYSPKDFLVKTYDGMGEQPLERMEKAMAVIEPVGEPMNDCRVLVAEDDADIASYLKRELGRYFVVETAPDGDEALRMLGDDGSGYSLVVTDAVMPRTDGFQLVSRMRKNVRLRHLPVVMLTALNADEDRVRGAEVGADAYVTKPFSMSFLILQCRNLLQRAGHRKKAAAEGGTEQAPAVSPDIIIDERDKKLLDKLAVWVDSHLASSDLSVDKFAADMGYGRSIFYGKLKSLTGLTPNEYIKERRLARAYDLLKDEQRITVTEVAYQVGVGTPQYLSVMFKKRFGVSPSQLQKGCDKDN